MAELIAREGVRPRTVTLLADHASIGQYEVEIEIGAEAAAHGSTGGASGTPADGSTGGASGTPADGSTGGANGTPADGSTGGASGTAADGSTGGASGTAAHGSTGGASGTPATAPAPPTHYLVKTEPFIPRDFERTVPMGVGRIPLESAADASVLFARGMVRERKLASEPMRVLMIANAGKMSKPLPLCEAVSRITAEEFKNFGVHVDEFYGQLADSPEILTAAKLARRRFSTRGIWATRT